MHSPGFLSRRTCLTLSKYFQLLSQTSMSKFDFIKMSCLTLSQMFSIKCEKPSITREREKKKKKKTLVSGGDRRELNVCLIHLQSDAHGTKVWR